MSHFTPTPRSRARRKPDRAAYDEAAVFAILDAGLLCHVGYVIDGQPFVTPTTYWREGRKLYWHGAAASRMLATVAEGLPVCVTVSFLDGFVVGRSGITHSLNYRSVMAFGQARLVTDPEEKRQALVMMVDRFFPHRTAGLRQSTEQEIKATAVVVMEIETASAKIRAKGVADDEEDYDLPIYAERLPIRTVIGAPEPCPRLQPGVARPADLAAYRAERPLEEALAEAHAAVYRD